MMKKILVAGIIIVSLLTAGAAAMLTYERMFKEEPKTETVSLVEADIEAIEESNEVMMNSILDLYLEAAKDIFGDDYDDAKATFNYEGLTYEGRFVSWNELEDRACDLLMEQV